uniref:Uncharacterized protein n=1 Tax=Tanacetum cinerariifolium TaxID=118510 RepID=A0A699UL37_TANCI|nr:hypothetical protein [Tanacetum cinerariifolium]
MGLHDDLDYPVSMVEAAADCVDIVDLRDRLSMIEHLLEQLAEFYSKHDPVKVVSLAGKTIQDAEMFEQLVDHRHLSQTPDVGVPPADR